MRTRLNTTGGWGLGLLLALPVSACLLFAAVVQGEQIPRYMGIGSGAAAGVTGTPGAVREKMNTHVMLTYAPLPVMPDFRPFSPQKVMDEVVAAVPETVDTKRYGGKEYKYVRTVKLRVTAYAADPRCCWPYPGTTTASGLPVTTNGGRLVAADTSVIAMHSLVVVPGYAGGAGVPVLDRGGAIKGNRLDVLLPSYEIAKKWGVRMVDVKVYAQVR